MKKLLKSTLAVSFAAMTLFSASISAGAYVVNDSNINALDAGDGYRWDTPDLQDDYPEFSASYVGNKNITATSKAISNNYMFCMLDVRSAKTVCEPCKDAAKLKKNFEDAKKLADKIGLRDKYGQEYALKLEYDEATDRFGLRAINDFGSIFNTAEIENFKVDKNTGSYSGDLIVNYAIAGLKIEAKDGMTTFEPGKMNVTFKTIIHPQTGETIKVRVMGYETVFHFSGKVPYGATNGVLFSKTESSTPYKILNKVDFVFGPNGKKFTTGFSKTIEKTPINSYYSGFRTGTGMTTYLSGSSATNFKNNNFECYRVEGSTLYLCIGSAAFQYKSTQDNFSIYWNKGGRDTWAQNDWLVKNMDKYSTIVFTANATQTNKGTAIRYTTPAELHKRIGR